MTELKVWIVVMFALVVPASAMAGYSAPSPKPSYSAPKTYSAPKVSIPTVKTYTPPTKPYSPPAQIPRSAPYSAFHDVHASNYWASPNSPYFYLWLAQYGHQNDSGGSGAWWIWVLGIGALLLSFGGVLYWIGR